MIKTQKIKYLLVENLKIKTKQQEMEIINNQVLWKQNVNILHIASTSASRFEKIDLRQNRWQINNDNIHNKFGVNIRTVCSRRFC